MNAKRLLTSVALCVALAGCKTDSADIPERKTSDHRDHSVMEADSAMESRIVTDKTLGAPFYANPVRGAAHMMRASDGYYYAYDGEVANWTIHRSANGVQWQSLGSKAYPEGTWGKKKFLGS